VEPGLHFTETDPGMGGQRLARWVQIPSGIMDCKDSTMPLPDDAAPDEPKSFFLSGELARYVADHSSQPDPVLTDLIDATRALGAVAGMQISSEQGAFMTLVARMMGAHTAVEVGTFTGYSSICIARGLANGGRLIACDVSDEWTTIARQAWRSAGVADRIDLRLGPAADTLAALPANLVVDLAFIDADKGGYRTYYDLLMTRLRPGGVILVDNVLWSGRVADATNTEADTIALREFNRYVADDTRVEVAMVPLADGLTIIRKHDTTP
jgi:caffeoyl-CoA O-methyltransferase